MFGNPTILNPTHECSGITGNLCVVNSKVVMNVLYLVNTIIALIIIGAMMVRM